MHELIQRTLWYESGEQILILTQADLPTKSDSLVVLGEAGMGKSELLTWIATHPGIARCTARQLINRANPSTLLGSASTLVIDALDEVTVQKEGDAVDAVLKQLGLLGYPRFILACRVADWRSATGVAAILEQYSTAPLQLHLAPFTKEDIRAFLRIRLDDLLADAVIEHFTKRGLGELLGNPQTLDMISRIAKDGPLPSTLTELFERSVEVLRTEHRDEKASFQVSKAEGLSAAGAAFSALIVSGAEAIVRTATANANEGELQVAEVARLPGGEAIEAMFGTRLFRGMGVDRFGYSHRRIGEFLGAQWLARSATSPRKRKRLLSLFHGYGLVPASLRGIHAWLAREPALAESVILADPMGVIGYGDADSLPVPQARTLIEALETLARDNPHFRGWGPYSARSLAQPELIGQVRKLITSPDTPFGLRLFVLEALKGAQLSGELAAELRQLVLDPKAIFASRSAAGEALISLDVVGNWPTVLAKLLEYGDELSLRLAIELSGEIEYLAVEEELIADLAVAYAAGGGRTIGVLSQLQHKFPAARLDALLDALTTRVEKHGKKFERSGDYELTDLAYGLVVRRVEAGKVQAKRLWDWLKPFDGSAGYRRESRQQLHQILQRDDALRRAVQRYVLLDLPGDHNVWQREIRLSRRSSGFSPSEDDVLELLNNLDPADVADERWREVVQLVLHTDSSGGTVRSAAKRFAEKRSNGVEWLDALTAPRREDWMVEQAKRDSAERDRRARELAEVRKDFSDNIERVRAGEFGAIVNPAKSYLKLFSGSEEFAPHERVERWLGQIVSNASLTGFESYLVREPLQPTPAEIVSSLTRGTHYDAAYILVCALAERLRTDRGFEDLSNERLLAGLFEMWGQGVDQYAGILLLREAVESEVRSRGIITDALRLFFEPLLQAGLAHVNGLYWLMREDRFAELGGELARDWLDRFPNLSVESETELVDRLLRSGRMDDLRAISPHRQCILEDQKRRYWDAVGLIADFEATAARLGASTIEPELLWHVRHCIGGRFGNGVRATLQAGQLEWMVKEFRKLWPMSGRSGTVTTGDKNSWDASDTIADMISRLGSDTSAGASAALSRLRAVMDGYTDTIMAVAAEQARARVEASYLAPSLDVLAAISRDEAPESTADLQAVMLDELAVVQAKIRSDDVESWRGFYDDKQSPYTEERCRDHVLSLLRQGSEGIVLEPETHVAGDKEVDITCSSGALRLPIEIKGQWHRELWRGADMQLDRLYTRDWRAEERGIYLVLWFGDVLEATKGLISPGRGVARPQSPEALRAMLAAGSRAARDGRISIVVLDLTRD